MDIGARGRRRTLSQSDGGLSGRVSFQAPNRRRFSSFDRALARRPALVLRRLYEWYWRDRLCRAADRERRQWWCSRYRAPRRGARAGGGADNTCERRAADRDLGWPG